MLPKGHDVDDPVVPIAESRARPVWLPRVLASFAALLALLSYLNALDNPFVYDDTREIIENPSIGNFTNLSAIFRHYPTRPLTNLTYAVDFALGGLAPRVFHVTSVALHVVNVLLLFTLVRLILGDSRSLGRRSALLPVAAFAASALFAVHPLLTEAVGYVSARAEVLVTTFCLASMLCFRAAATGSHVRSSLTAGALFFVLALGAKETAVMLPVLLVAYDRLMLHKTGERRSNTLSRVALPLIAVALMLGALRMWRYLQVEHPESAGFSFTHLLTEIDVFRRYVWLLVFPVGQSLVPDVRLVQSPLEIDVLIAVLVIASMIAAGLVTRRHQPVIMLGIVWFFLMLLPSAALIVIADRGEPMAEHRVYLASCGFFMACAGFIALSRQNEAPRIRWRLTAVTLALVGALPTLTALTIARNRVWSDPVRLLADAAGKAPDVWLAQYGLADAHRAQGNCEAAIPVYRRAIALRPQNADGHLGLAQCFLDTLQINQARDTLRETIAQTPSDVRAHLALATMEERLFNRPDEALRLCREALVHVPSSDEARECVERLAGRRSK